MLMTSNSHAECHVRFGLRIFLTLLLFAIPASGQQVAPDSPRPARQAPQTTRPSVVQSDKVQTVELRSVTVRSPTAEQRKLASEDFWKSADEPLLIEVRTLAPLGDLTRTSSPVIVLNGKQLSETIPFGRDRLIAFLPDRKLIRRTNTVAVEWLGDERLTRSRRPLVFNSRDINR